MATHSISYSPFLPGESQGRGSPGGLLSMGLHRIGHNCSDLAAAAAAAPRPTANMFSVTEYSTWYQKDR